MGWFRTHPQLVRSEELAGAVAPPCWRSGRVGDGGGAAHTQAKALTRLCFLHAR